MSRSPSSRREPALSTMSTTDPHGEFESRLSASWCRLTLTSAGDRVLITTAAPRPTQARLGGLNQSKKSQRATRRPKLRRVPSTQVSSRHHVTKGVMYHSLVRGPGGT